MNSLIKKIFMLIFAGVLMTSADAQTLNNLLSRISSKTGSGTGTVSSIVDNLIGTKKVTANKIVGKWIYSKPAIAFESQNALSNIGGSVVSSKLESKLDNAFRKVGITKGKFSITFANNGTFTSVINKKTMKGVYTINGSTITLSRTATAKVKVTANVKLGTTLQLTFKADKLLTFAKQFGALAGSASTTMQAVTSLAKNYKGLQIGMHYTKSN